MKLFALGVILVMYACFLSPAFVEPWDVVVSTGYIAIANERGVDPIFIWIWMMSGYIALIAGVFLGVGGAYIHFKHPIIVLAIISVFAGIIAYWFLFVSGLVS